MKKFLVLMCVLSLFLAGNAYSASVSETGMSQGDLVRLLKSLKTAVLSRAISSGSLTTLFGVAQGATAQTQSAFTYTINGRFYNMAASTNIWLNTTAVQPVSTYCRYLFTINASGKITVTKGNNSSATATTYLPAVPAGNAVFGSALIKTSAASAFTMGSNQFRATMLPFAPVWYQLSAAASESSMMVLP
jgi:hypothetical protein